MKTWISQWKPISVELYTVWQGWSVQCEARHHLEYWVFPLSHRESLKSDMSKGMTYQACIWEREISRRDEIIEDIKGWKILQLFSKLGMKVWSEIVAVKRQSKRQRYSVSTIYKIWLLMRRESRLCSGDSFVWLIKWDSRIAGEGLVWVTHDELGLFLTSAGASQVLLVVKNLSANAGNVGDSGSVPRLGRAPGEGHGSPLQYSCLGMPWREDPGGQ